VAPDSTDPRRASGRSRASSSPAAGRGRTSGAARARRAPCTSRRARHSS